MESHSDHIEEAKLKIEEIIERGKEEFNNFLIKVNDQASKMVDNRNSNQTDQLRKKIEENKNQRIKELELLRNKVDSFIERERSSAQLAFKIIDKIVLSESFNPMLTKLEESVNF